MFLGEFHVALLVTTFRKHHQATLQLSSGLDCLGPNLAQDFSVVSYKIYDSRCSYRSEIVTSFITNPSPMNIQSIC